MHPVLLGARPADRAPDSEHYFAGHVRNRVGPRPAVRVYATTAGESMSKRDEYVERLKAQLDQWNAEVTKWEAQAREAQASMRAEYDKQLAEFRERRDQALKTLHDVQSASVDMWADLARGSDEAWAKMREAFEKARSHFHK